MSADNWRVCPACKRKHEAKHETLKLEAGAAYGKVPREEYLAMLEKSIEPLNLEETLREDYEIGVDSKGEFFVSYGASCQTCDFTFAFNHKEPLLKEAPSA